jgi:hypothetical protein
MKKVVLLAAVSVLLAGSVAQAATPTGPGKPTLTMQFLDVTTSSAATIANNQHPKLGDRFFSHDKVYTWRGLKRGPQVGTADTSFVVLGQNLGEVSGLASLPGGTLAIEGQVSFTTLTSTIPVIGGTGRYATARGEVTVRTIGGPDSNKSAITLRLWM